MAKRQYNGFSPRHRSKAGRWYTKQLREGKRTKPERCDACLRTGASVAGHSEDYREPFGDHIGAVSLCYPCHMAIHCRFTMPEEFERYRQGVADGNRFPEVGRNFYAFMRLFKDPVWAKANPARVQTWLDTLLLDEEQTLTLYPEREMTLDEA